MAAAIALLPCIAPDQARGGGFDIPDLGTEALGRGGAFVAKADSGLAMYYNVAGLARQRGTGALLDVNLVWNDIAFTRAGSYAGDPKDPRTPWAGKPYPTIHNSGGLGYQPFLAVTTDGGWFRNWTFGLAVYAPPGIGRRQYGIRRDLVVTDKLGVQHETPRYEVELPNSDDGSSWQAPSGPQRAPAPSRYDLAAADLTILMPTLGAAYHAHKVLDVGAGVTWVIARFDLLNANITNLGPSTCIGSPEYPGCDAYGEVHTSTQTIAFVLSALAHPLPWLDVGLTVRPQVNLDSSGTIHPYPVASDGTQLPDFAATFGVKLPTIVRWGVRAALRYPDGSERGDLELDGTWENWSIEQAAQVHSDHAGPDGLGTLQIDVPHLYKDTFSLRLGGAWNLPLSARSRFTARLGSYYDSPTTDVRNIHLDAFTTEKVGFTLGVGLQLRGFTLNLAYAGLWMPTHDVSNSPLKAASSTNGTEWPRDPMGGCIDPCPVVGNGRYDPWIHMLSVGLTVHFDDFRSRS